MNSLILTPHEVSEDGKVHIEGARLEYVLNWHQLQAGITVKCGVWGQKMGTLEIEALDGFGLTGRFKGVEDPPAKRQILAIVAVPRPQAFKRCLQVAVAFGVRDLYFVRTANVVPSYMSSHSLREGDIRSELLKSMEQVCDSVPPRVKIFENWRYFIESVSKSAIESPGRKLVADTRAQICFSENKSEAVSAVAVGPEKGWTESELNDLCNCGFESVVLGKRILRVDHALTQMVVAPRVSI